MQNDVKEFIDTLTDLSVGNFGKQSNTQKTDRTHFRLDRQSFFSKYNKDWGNFQIQLNSQLVTKNKKNFSTSIAAVIFETGYTFPKDVVRTAFRVSLEENKQVYVTVNLDCDE
jgi:hypothetical protein